MSAGPGLGGGGGGGGGGVGVGPGSDRARFVLGVVVPGLGVALAFAPWIAFWGRLPDEVATLWGFDGEPVIENSRTMTVWIYAVMTLTLVVPAVRKVLAAPPDRPLPRLLVLTAGGGAIGLAALSTGVVAANLDASSAEATHVSFVVTVVFVAALSGAGWLARWVAGRGPEPAVPEVSPKLVLEAGERAAWNGTARNRWMAPVAWFLFVTFAVFFVGLLAEGELSPLALVVALLGGWTLTWSRVRVTVGAGGIRMAFGPFGWLRRAVPLDAVAGAVAIDVDLPMPWAYRVGRLRPSAGDGELPGRIYAVRQGRGLRLELRDGTQVVIAVDGADAATAVVNGLLATPPADPTTAPAPA